jgi:hypothetical protein
MIDLRSDVCSRPTAEMRTTMTNAETGDDVYGDDPTVKALESAIADLLGKEDAVYMPTGTIANQVGSRSHTEPGDAVLFDIRARMYISSKAARRPPSRASCPACCGGLAQLDRIFERGEPGGRRRKLFGGRGHRLLFWRNLVSGSITDRLAHGGCDMRLGHAATVLSQIGLSGAFDPCGHAQRHVFQSLSQIPWLSPVNQPHVEQ